MPLYGQLQTADRDVPLIESIATDEDAWTSNGAEILTFTSEMDADRGFLTIPPALHPSLPPYVQIIFRRIDDGPFGEFVTAEINVRGRSTIHQVGYTVAAYASSSDAVAWLRDRFGQPTVLADLNFARRYYGIEASIAVDGHVLFDGLMETPHYISPSDVLFTHSMNLARLPDERVRLVQMELDYVLERAERGVARIGAFDAPGLGDANMVLTNPLPPTLVRAKEIGYLSVRYVLDPKQPAMTGTEKIG